jgi:MBG domain (YGX type)/MBG domain/Secretion system C-terminal sorting domain
LEPLVGQVDETIIYIRAAEDAIFGLIQGDITLTSEGANSRIVEVNGLVLNEPILNSKELKGGLVGSSYSETTGYAQQGVVFSAIGLPLGLTISNDGSVSGIPTVGMLNQEVLVTASNGYCSTTKVFTISIAKANASIFISNTSHVYNGTAKEVSISTVPEGLPVLIAYGSTTEPPTSAGSYNVQVSIVSNSYQGYESKIMTIAKGIALLSIESEVHTYDGKPHPAKFSTVPADLPISILYNNTLTPPINASVYAVTANVNSPNYEGVKSGILTINKAPLTISANSISRVYLEANPVLSFSYSGFVNGENSNVIDQLPDISTDAGLTSDVGSYPIILSGGSDNNYSMELQNGSLTINKASQSITFQTIGNRFSNDTPFEIFASASSALQVIFTVVNGPAQIDGNVLSLTNESGSVTIRAHQSGNNNYLPVSQDQSFDVILVLEIDPGSNSIQVYPNPASNYLIIIVPNDQYGFDAELVNSLGVRIKSFKVFERIEVSVSDLATGLYQMRLIKNNKIITRNILIK